MEDEYLLPIDWTEEKNSIIKVIGVGGGGGNAVNYMHQQGIHDVNFIVCNTDRQDLDKSTVPVKISLGELGAGGDPEVGREAAQKHIEKIRDALNTGAKMVFVTAGMGGGTGTGAAPVIAQTAKEMGILTVAIVTIPFSHEGQKRLQQAKEGINELKNHVDALLVINNDKLREMYGDLTISNAFSKADNVLTMAAKGIAEVITLSGKINVDFNDVKSVMENGGMTVMGSATASGENRAQEAIEAALSSPLLSNSDITGAKRILLNITSGTGKNELTMDEMTIITDFVTRSAKQCDIMMQGVCYDEKLGEAVSVTVVATDFQNSSFIDPALELIDKPKPDVIVLNNEKTPERVIFNANDDTQTSDNQEKTISTWTMPETESIPKERVARPIPVILEENANIDELENTPAYVRRQIKLENQRSTTEKEVSKYTLASEKGNTVRLRDNNSYLYDVVC